MGNYDRVKGVRVSYYDSDSEGPDPDWEENAAEVEELYPDAKGDLCLSVNTGEGTFFIDVPIRACDDWNEFVESLPEWDGV
jgi:hypothetical protein